MLLLLLGQLRRHEVVGAGERSQERRKRRTIVLIAAPRQYAQNRRRQREARAAKSPRPCSGRRLNSILCALQLLLDLPLAVKMQPRLMFEGVVADLVARISQ